MEQVANILKVSSAARNSDRELLILYMQKFGMELTLKQIEKFRKMPSTETIRRSRQAIQEQGKYLASPAVEEERFRKYKQMKNMPFEDPEELLKKQGYTVRPWGK